MKYFLRALHYAATLESESDKIIYILIKNGANVNSINNYLQTPLFLAVKSNNIIGASSLLDFNADIYSRDINGLTAFEQIKEIEEWLRSDIFNKDQKAILKSKASFCITFNFIYLFNLYRANNPLK